MYRPLYWFGETRHGVDLNLRSRWPRSPVYSNNDKHRDINLKDYKWSNGESVTATDVMFWMNMLHAEKANWAAYAPGDLPGQRQELTVNSPTQLTFQLTRVLQPALVHLQRVRPDHPDAGGLGHHLAGRGARLGRLLPAPPTARPTRPCAAVYTFLSKQAGYDPTNPSGANNALATYATNPLWQVVDGPWHLTSFNA